MCIAAGCDYLRNVKGVGIHTAYHFVHQSTGNFLELLLKRGGSEEYKNSFKKVEKVFKHQTVFNFNSHSATPLEKCEADLTEDVQYLCGKLSILNCFNISYTAAYLKFVHRRIVPVVFWP